MKDSPVAVVRGRRQEQPVLEVRRERPDRRRAQRVGRVAARPGGRDVVHLVDDQQVEAARVGRPSGGRTSSQEAHRAVALEPVDRDDQPREVRPTGSLRSPRRPAQLAQQVASRRCGTRGRTSRASRPATSPAGSAGQTTSTVRARWRSSSSWSDEAGLDRLAEADVVGDQQVDPRHLERPDDRVELVVLDRDAARNGACSAGSPPR